MKATEIIRQNFIAVFIGLFFFGLYLFFTYSGNRLCGCAPSEKYKPTHTGSSSGAYYHRGINRYHHK